MRAFPRPGNVDPTQGTLEEGDHYIAEQNGMTLRDYFAGQAMQGLISGTPRAWDDDSEPVQRSDADLLAADAVIIADALIRRLYP